MSRPAGTITLGYPDEGVREIYANGPDTILAGTAVPGGVHAVPVDGGYRVTGRWSFGSGCREVTGSFAIPGRGPGYWRGTFARHEVTVVPGSWDVTGMRWTGSFDWTVEDCSFRSNSVSLAAPSTGYQGQASPLG